MKRKRLIVVYASNIFQKGCRAILINETSILKLQGKLKCLYFSLRYLISGSFLHSGLLKLSKMSLSFFLKETTGLLIAKTCSKKFAIWVFEKLQSLQKICNESRTWRMKNILSIVRTVKMINVHNKNQTINIHNRN